MKPIAIQVSPKLTRATADCWYGSLLPSSERYGANAGRARKLAIVNSPMTMARVRNAPLSRATRRFGRMIRTMIREPAGAEALRRLGQAPDVHRPQARVDRPVHVRERQDDVAEHEQRVLPMSVWVNGSGGWL